MCALKTPSHEHMCVAYTSWKISLNRTAIKAMFCLCTRWEMQMHPENCMEHVLFWTPHEAIIGVLWLGLCRKIQEGEEMHFHVFPTYLLPSMTLQKPSKWKWVCVCVSQKNTFKILLLSFCIIFIILRPEAAASFHFSTRALFHLRLFPCDLPIFASVTLLL